MAHTPGPWHAYRADYRRERDDDPLPIFVIGPEEFHTVAQVCAGNEDDDLPAQTEDNARLLAAATELLAALRALTPMRHPDDAHLERIATGTMWRTDGGCGLSAQKARDIQAARAAIAKATGESL